MRDSDFYSGGTKGALHITDLRVSDAKRISNFGSRCRADHVDMAIPQSPPLAPYFGLGL
jgi:hypothetical protein